MRLRWIVLLTAALSGCASNEYFNGPILDIEGDVLGRYWVESHGVIAFEAPPAQKDDCGDGFVTVLFVIDSGGNVSEADVIDSAPPGCYEEVALLLVQTWKYVPTGFNSRKTPVRVSQRIPFSSE
ncbi:MAG: TonB family protein [Pseudomonadota bacterium]